MPDEFDNDRKAQPDWRTRVMPDSRRMDMPRPTQWEVEHEREADAGDGPGPGELPGDMSLGDALSASEADLVAPDMRAALRDRAIDLAASDSNDPAEPDEPGTGEGSVWRRISHVLRRGR